MTRIATLWALCCIAVSVGASTATARNIAIGLPFRDGQKEWKAAADVAAQLKADDVAITVDLVPRTKSGPTVSEEIKQGKLTGGLLFGDGAKALGISADAQIYALPFTFTSGEQIDRVRKSLDADVLAAVSEGPYEAMGFVALGAALALSSSSLATPQDWQQRKLWVPEEWQDSKGLATTGLTPVPLPAADVRKGMKAGTIDMVIAPPAIAVLKQWHRRAENVLTMPCAYLYGIWLVQDSELEGLTDEQRARLQAFFDELGGVLAKLAATRDRDARDVFEGFGIAVNAGGPELIEKWRVWRNAFRSGKTPTELPRQSLLDALDRLLESPPSEDRN